MHVNVHLMEGFGNSSSLISCVDLFLAALSTLIRLWKLLFPCSTMEAKFCNRNNQLCRIISLHANLQRKRKYNGEAVVTRNGKRSIKSTTLGVYLICTCMEDCICFRGRMCLLLTLDLQRSQKWTCNERCRCSDFSIKDISTLHKTINRQICQWPVEVPWCEP